MTTCGLQLPVAQAALSILRKKLNHVEHVGILVLQAPRDAQADRYRLLRINFVTETVVLYHSTMFSKYI